MRGPHSDRMLASRDIAAELGCSLRTAQRLLRSLESTGDVTRIHNAKHRPYFAINESVFRWRTARPATAITEAEPKEAT